MKRSLAWVWASVFLVLLVYLLFLAASLPERLAVHFDIDGNPNGFQPKMVFMTTFLFFILLINAICSLLFVFIEKLPMALVNIPWKKYWAASPERWEEAHHRIRIVLGMTGLFVNTAFLVTEQIIYQANNPEAANLIPAHSGLLGILVLSVLFLGAVFWTTKPPKG